MRERFYYLPLTSSCLPGCPFCDDLGCKNFETRSLESIESGLLRARSANIQTVSLPSGFLIFPLKDKVIELARINNLQIIVQVPIAKSVSITADLSGVLSDLNRKGCEFNFLISNRDSLFKYEPILEFSHKFPHSYFTLIIQKGLKLSAVLSRMNNITWEKTYLYFPMKHSVADHNLSCAQINRELIALRKEIPQFQIKPPRGTEVWNKKINPQLGLEPVDLPAASSVSPMPGINISVIIPTFNNRAYLLNTIAHLLLQDMRPDNFEVVIVDDGSTDDTHQELIDLIREQNGIFNIKYIYFPRRSQRSMGDGNFRAGIARNLGVKSSAGRILAFLDSDILTPSDFLARTLEAHRSHDVVQCIRLNLKNTIPCDSVRYQDVDPARDTAAFEGDYWKIFFDSVTWEHLAFYWKYTCTYGLSMSRETFEKVGWFRKSFVHYGFEDTELGYRLAKLNLKFHLSPVVTYHCFHKSERSEFKNLDFHRHQLLSKTAKIFYHNILDPEVYDHFSFYLNDRAAWISFCLGAIARRILSVSSRVRRLSGEFNV